MRFAITMVLVLVACGAPRDPELEKQVLLARRAQAQAPDDDEGGGPPAAPVLATRPTKTFAGDEIAGILKGVPGTGTSLVAVFTTDKGTLTCTLDERAPQTVANFVGLATGQLEWKPDASEAARRTRFYDGLTFHRIVNEFIIQTGNPTGKANAGPGWRLAREQGANDLFLQAGAMGMIDDAELAHGSQFFITAKPDKGLGNTYSAFGRCEPVELVKAISSAEKKTGSDGKSPAVPVVISSVKVEHRP